MLFEHAALSHADLLALQVAQRRILCRVALAYHQLRAGIGVRIGERKGFHALGRDAHLADDDVVFTGGQAREDRAPFRGDEHGFQAQLGGDQLGHVDVITAQFTRFLVLEIERRIGALHGNAQRALLAHLVEQVACAGGNEDGGGKDDGEQAMKDWHCCWA